MSKFTNRFLKVPICLYNREQADLLDQKGDEVETLVTTARLLPMQIETYYATITDDKEFLKDNMKVTKVWMKSGESFIIRMTIEEFEDLLNQSIE